MPADGVTAPRLAGHRLGEGEDLSVLSRWFRWRDAPNGARQRLNAEARDLLERRREQVAALTSADDWRRRQVAVRRTLHELLGPFPERTPLNAQVTGVVRKPGYRIEHVVFESRPQFYVTACLFIPERLAGPTPAIVNPIGHSDIGFRESTNQVLALNLVRKGFIVCCFDPVGQGERVQYLDPATGRSRLGGCTREHSHFTRQTLLAGRSSGHYFAWDGIRAIDYLLTRPEVDARRIGITGISGGGTQTAYISALDERLAAAAPTCYITSMHRLLESLGPQDGEQNLLGGVLAGLDHADFLEVQAPRPILVMANTRDYFSIQGARETCAEVARAYAALGAPSAFREEEDDAPHGFTPVSRSFLYAFFQQSLNLPGDPREEPVEPLPMADLTVTPSGQLATSLGGETVFSLNRAAAAALGAALDRRRGALGEHLATVRGAATRLSGYRPPAESAPCFVGRHRREGYHVEKVVLEGADGGVLPSLVLAPAGAGRFPAALWLDSAGKSAAVEPSATAVALAKRGWVVLLPDLSLVGELATAAGDWTFEPALLGRSWPGVRAGEIGQALAYLRARDDVAPGPIAAFANGALGPALLHAALADASVRPVVLYQTLFAWQDVVRQRLSTTEFSAIVPGALTAYDLPDLAACLAPRPLLVLNPLNAVGEPGDAEQIHALWGVTRQAYRTQQAEHAYLLDMDAEEGRVIEKLEQWRQDA